VDGASRIDEGRLAGELGVEDVRRADPDTVRAATGNVVDGLAARDQVRFVSRW
jgi:prolyl-tRNA editing enzyme YbaK/EbsC (Cys-tRNA(Pro) deacylase)